MTRSALADGVYTVVPTPFHDDGSLDLVSLDRLVTFLAGDAGVQGLLILGVLGEAAKLVPDERRKVIETCLAAASGCPVIVGATHQSVVGTRTLASVAVEAGAAAVMIAPPRLDRLSGAEGLVEYFAESTAGLGVEAVLQDHPASSGVPLPSALIEPIVAAAPAIGSIKMEDPPTPQKVGTLAAVVPETKVFGGLGGVFLLEELRRGANGTMTGYAFPETLVEIQRAHAAGSDEQAEEIFFRALPLIRFEFQEAVGLAVRKAVYVMRGLITSAHVRAPGVQIDDRTLHEVRHLVESFGRPVAR